MSVRSKTYTEARVELEFPDSYPSTYGDPIEPIAITVHCRINLARDWSIPKVARCAKFLEIEQNDSRTCTLRAMDLSGGQISMDVLSVISLTFHSALIYHVYSVSLHVLFSRSCLYVTHLSRCSLVASRLSQVQVSQQWFGTTPHAHVSSRP